MSEVLPAWSATEPSVADTISFPVVAGLARLADRAERVARTWSPRPPA